MANFDQLPQPGYDPNYIFWSRPDRTQPRGSEAGEIMGKGTGALIKEGTEAADTYVKDNIQAGIFDVVDRERAGFTSALETVKDMKTQPPASSQQPLNILPTQQGAPPPEDIHRAISGVQSLQTAYGSGKVNEAYYYQRLIPQLQSIRDKFPGYRDYIDQETSRIVGVNPANAYMRSLLQQINERDTQRNEEKSKAYGLIESMAKDGDIHAGAYQKAYDAGKMTYAQLIDKAGQSFSYKRFLESTKVRLAELSEARAERGDQEAQNQDDYMRIQHHNISTFMTTPIDSAGMGATPKDLTDKAFYLATHPGSIPNQDVVSQNLMHQLVAARARLVSSMASETEFSGLGDKLKPEWKAQADKEMMGVLDQYIDLMGDPKQFPMATSLAKASEAITKGDVYALKVSPQYGDISRKIAAGRELFGNQVPPSVMQAWIGDPAQTFGLQTYNMGNTLDLWGQQFINPEAAQNPYTVGGKIADAKTDLPLSEVPRTTTQFLKQINAFVDKGTPEPAREALAKAFYSPVEANRKLLDQFDDESRWKVFGMLTGKEMTRYAVKLGGRDRQFFDNYQNTAEAWFDTLVSKNVIPSLYEAEKSYGRGSSSVEYRARHGQASDIDNPLQYMWDSERDRLWLTPESEAMVRKTEGPYWQRSNLIRSLNQFNSALANMSHIQKAAGGDVSTYLMKLMALEGIRVNEQTAGKIHNAIVSSGTVHGQEEASDDDRDQ